MKIYQFTEFYLVIECSHVDFFELQYMERFYKMTDLAVPFLHRLSGQGKSW